MKLHTIEVTTVAPNLCGCLVRTSYRQAITDHELAVYSVRDGWAVLVWLTNEMQTAIRRETGVRVADLRWEGRTVEI